MDTLDLQEQQVTENKSNFLSNKIFQTLLMILLISSVSSFVTWYLISNKNTNSNVSKENNSSEIKNNESETDDIELDASKDSNLAVNLDRIKNGSTISSPLVLRGTVTQGWMFEGQFTVQIVGADGKVITQVPLGDLYDGGWVESDPVAFEGRVEFTTEQTSGNIVFKKANPSGLPENDKSHKVPVNFAKKDFQALLKDICKYKGANIYPNYIYKISDLPIKSENAGEDGVCIQGYVKDIDEGLKNAYLSLDLFNNSESKTTILVHDEMSLEGGHGGPPFLGFYGKEIYNQNNIRLGVYLIPSMGDLYPKDFNSS